MGEKIARNSVTLYRKSTDYTEIHIRIGKKGGITTYWRTRSRENACRSGKKSIIKKRQFMHKLKINGCAMCGYNKCDAALDFHHVNPKDKKFGFSLRWFSMSNEVLAKELNKCILLCSNCHRELHAKEKLKC